MPCKQFREGHTGSTQVRLAVIVRFSLVFLLDAETPFFPHPIPHFDHLPTIGKMILAFLTLIMLLPLPLSFCWPACQHPVYFFKLKGPLFLEVFANLPSSSLSVRASWCCICTCFGHLFFGSLIILFLSWKALTNEFCKCLYLLSGRESKSDNQCVSVNAVERILSNLGRNLYYRHYLQATEFTLDHLG